MPKEIEIIAIGNELLKGITVNTNAAEIALALYRNGYKCRQQIVVPDDREMIQQQLRNSLTPHTIVIATGGLGPTCDDITRQTAAEIFDSGFVFNEVLAAELKQRYGNLPINLNDQATVPTKATLLHNPLGTAPGFLFQSEIGTLILMPGVPKEMRRMLHDQVIPYLTTHFPVTFPPISKSIHLFGLGESMVDPLLRELEIEYPHVEFGIYPSHGLISIYASINQPDEVSESQLSRIMETLKKQFEKNFFSDSSDKNEVAIQDLFTANKWTLGVAESCTGGAISAKLVKNPGASSYFLGGVVTYTNKLKEKLLHIDPLILNSKGAVSEETVREMAIGALDLIGSDFAIATTGIAGPGGGSEEKPVGTVWIAIAKRGEEVFCHKIMGYGDREMIIQKSVNCILGFLYQYGIKFTSERKS